VGTLHFEPSARLQQFLGRELIADPNLAIAEFIKNGYDAGATEVYVDFRVAGLRPVEQVIRITDNGTGMDLDDFKANWMHPGFSYKATAVPSQNKKPRAETPQARREARIPIGEKGIGRLAAGRLGERLHIFTKRRRRDPWLHVLFDWGAFKDMNMPLSKVPIRYDFDTQPEEPRVDTGTIVEIEELTLNWAGRVPGRKSAGRSDSRVGRLRQDLEILILPLEPLSEDFRVLLASDLSEHGPFLGQVTPADMQLMEYRYDFTVERTRAGVRVRRKVTRSASLADQLGQPRSTKDTITIAATTRPTDDPTSHPGSLECGTFHGTIYYAPWSGSARRLRDLHIQPGVFVYRDGIRVEPYGGPDDDWLGAQARKASRQGYAAIQPKQLYGFVAISKRTNPALIDMSNRQGLVEDEAFEDFVTHARAEFRNFETIVFDEFVEPAWEVDTDRAQRLAERTQTSTAVIIRDLVHSLRQPVAGLGTELGNLEFVLQNFPIPDDTRTRLEEVQQRATAHVHDIDALVTEFLEVRPEADVEPVAIRDIVAEAVTAVSNLAATNGVEIEVDIDNRAVVARPLYLRRAVTELIRNAVQAPRPQNVDRRWVRVTNDTANGSALITVTDNGLGVNEDLASRLFKEPVSTTGRQGAGLTTARDLVATFRGQIELINPGEAGAIFQIRLPSMGALRKELRT
jgi:signal transduction histidine kinase